MNEHAAAADGGDQVTAWGGVNLAMLALAHDQRVMREDRGWFCLPEVDLGLTFQPFQLALIRARLAPQTAPVGRRRCV